MGKKIAEEVIQEFKIGDETYSIVRREDKMFSIKRGEKVVSLSSTEEIAEGKFKKLIMNLKGGEEEMDGLEKARAVADKLKAETQQAEETAVAQKTEVLNHLAALKDNADLAKMYQDNSKAGAENLGGESPLLKVHAVGKSTKNELFDGAEPNDGWFFYKPSAEQYESVECHILTISKGFRAQSLEEGKKDQFNQIIGGVIVDNGDYKPFIMYFTGLKLSNLWEFAKLAAKYTRAKPIGIPMFALTVTLTTVKKANSYGKSWVVNFEIKKNDEGQPILVLDPGEFTYLKDSVETIEESIAALIEAKEVKEQGEEVIVDVNPLAGTVRVSDGVPTNVEEIPF